MAFSWVLMERSILSVSVLSQSLLNYVDFSSTWGSLSRAVSMHAEKFDDDAKITNFGIFAGIAVECAI